MPIPAWNPKGLLPPFEADATSGPRSPYNAGLVDVVSRFGTTPPRLTILGGLLRVREWLHDVGVVDGFQWLDGSFAEDIETIDSRPPRDIDVVTFAYAPAGFDHSAHGMLFDREYIKKFFLVDHIPLNLTYLAKDPRLLIGLSAYWYGVWSHRRSSEWKGYIQVDLNPSQDVEARAALDSLRVVVAA